MKLKDYLEDNGVVLARKFSKWAPANKISCYVRLCGRIGPRSWKNGLDLRLPCKRRPQEKTNSKYRADPGRRNRCQGNEQGYLLFARLFPTCKKRKGLIQSHMCVLGAYVNPNNPKQVLIEYDDGNTYTHHEIK